ncbi:hypothetical protein KC363_g7254 [Hortaea werneckii]|nr:hypothetical protein KC363_g7254 [Hortaea werneckii]
MPPSAFRQDHFLSSLIQGVETESAVRAELLQKAEDRDDLSKAKSRKNAVAASSERIEDLRNALLQYTIQFARHQRTDDARGLTSILHKKLTQFVGQLSAVAEVDQLAPELENYKKELQTCKEKSHELVKARKDAEDELQRARAECTRVKMEFSQVQDKLTQTTEELRQTKSELRQAESETARERLVSAQLRNDVARAEEERKQSTSELREREGALLSAADHRHQAELQIRAAQKAQKQSEATLAEERMRARKVQQEAEHLHATTRDSLAAYGNGG